MKFLAIVSQSTDIFLKKNSTICQYNTINIINVNSVLKLTKIQ